MTIIVPLHNPNLNCPLIFSTAIVILMGISQSVRQRTFGSATNEQQRSACCLVSYSLD